jgi:hypothetical protein
MRGAYQEGGKPGEITSAMKTPEEYQRAITELTTTSPEVAEAQSARLDEVVDEALRHTVGEHERQVLEYARGIFKWTLFGKSEEQLPDGLVIGSHRGRPAVRLDARKLITLDCIIDAGSRLEQFGFEEVVEAVDADIESRSDAVREEMQGESRQNPAYLFMQSFDVHAQPEIVDVPLDEREKAIRAGQVRQEVIERHNLLEPGGVFERASSADTELRRGLWHIDDETKPQVESRSDQNPTERARAYLAERAIDYHIARRDNIEDTPEVRERLKQLMLSTDAPADNAEGYDRFILFDDATSSTYVLSEELTEGSPLMEEVLAGSILRNYVNTLLRDYDPSLPYDQAVEKTVNQAVQEVWEFMFDDIGKAGALDNIGEYDPAIRNSLMTPRGEQVPQGTLTEHAHLHHHGTGDTEFMTREAAESLQEQYVGHIESGTIPGMRVLQIRSRDETLPHTSDRSDAVLRLHGREFNDHDPSIPGFTLVARNDLEGRYEFTRNDTDPYASPEVPISTQQAQELADTYRAIGLNQLAFRMSQNTELTVADLAEYITIYSTYPLPQETRYSEQYPRSHSTPDLESFRDFVDDGRLAVQCTGAKNFMKLSLQQLFGVESASSIAGRAIGTGDITELQHGQTTFTHNGESYIIDTTPPSRAGMGTLPNPPSDAPLRPPRPTAHEQLQRTPRQQEISAEIPRDPSAQLHAARASLETQLGAAMGIRGQQALYEAVAKLQPNVDPVRRTTEMAIQAAEGAATREAAESLVTYLQNYRQQPRETLRAQGYPVYEPRLLDLLHMTAQRIYRNA